jgi:hypothetical protein
MTAAGFAGQIADVNTVTALQAIQATCDLHWAAAGRGRRGPDRPGPCSPSVTEFARSEGKGPSPRDFRDGKAGLWPAWVEFPLACHFHRDSPRERFHCPWPSSQRIADATGLDSGCSRRSRSHLAKEPRLPREGQPAASSLPRCPTGVAPLPQSRSPGEIANARILAVFVIRCGTDLVSVPSIHITRLREHRGTWPGRKKVSKHDDEG